MRVTNTRQNGGEWSDSESWALVVASRTPNAPAARQVLDQLIGAYWHPTYVYMRLWGITSEEEARELTQEFFTRLLDRGDFAAVDPSKGNFQAWLRRCCRNFLLNHKNKVRHDPIDDALSIHFRDGSHRDLGEPVDSSTADRLEDQRRASTLIALILGRLERQMTELGKARLYELLKRGLLGEPEAPPHSRIAVELGMTAGAVRVAAYHVRRRFRLLVIKELSRNRADPAQIEDAVNDLFLALRRSRTVRLLPVPRRIARKNRGLSV